MEKEMRNMKVVKPCPECSAIEGFLSMSQNGKRNKYK
jgi:hypothetical protein